MQSLRAQLRRGSLGFASWGMDILVSVLVYPFGPALDSELRAAALGVLTEACASKLYAVVAVTLLKSNLAAMGLGTLQCADCPRNPLVGR